MSFKTMDGEEVYTAQDVEQILGKQTDPEYGNTIRGKLDTIIQEIGDDSISTSIKGKVYTLDALQHTVDQDIIPALSNHANTIRTNASNIEALQTSKVSKAELPSLVHSNVNDIIQAKLQLIESDINHIVDNAIDDELEHYDTSLQTTNKINNAINNIPSPTVATALEVQTIVNQYF